MLHVDVPTLAERRALHQARADGCVSIYVSTTPQTQNVKASRIAFKNLAQAGLQQLDAATFDKRRKAQLEAELAALAGDDEFWAFQAHSLAVLATPDSVRTFRLATAISDSVEVSDRFHIKPLLRAVAFPQHAFVLALSENGVRLVEAFADLPPSRSSPASDFWECVGRIFPTVRLSRQPCAIRSRPRPKRAGGRPIS